MILSCYPVGSRVAVVSVRLPSAEEDSLAWRLIDIGLSPGPFMMPTAAMNVVAAALDDPEKLNAEAFLPGREPDAAHEPLTE